MVLVIVTTERYLQASVVAELGRLQDRGVMWHHCNASWRCLGPSGLPDLVIAGPGGLLLAELKGPNGELSAAQDAWRWAIDRGAPVQGPFRLWRPDDWAGGRIQAELRSLAG